MQVKPYNTDEQESQKVSEPGTPFGAFSRTHAEASVPSPKKREAMPDGCISSEDFWSLFEHKMRVAYAEL